MKQVKKISFLILPIWVPSWLSKLTSLWLKFYFIHAYSLGCRVRKAHQRVGVLKKCWVNHHCEKLRCVWCFKKCESWKKCEYGGSEVRSLSKFGNSCKIHKFRKFAYVLLFPVFKGLMVDSDLGHIILMISYFHTVA